MAAHISHFSATAPPLPGLLAASLLFGSSNRCAWLCLVLTSRYTFVCLLPLVHSPRKSAPMDRVDAHPLPSSHLMRPGHAVFDLGAGNRGRRPVPGTQTLTRPYPGSWSPTSLIPSGQLFLVARPTPSVHGDLPLYQLTMGLGVPVTRQASLTVSPSSAVQSASSSSKSGGPEDTHHTHGPSAYPALSAPLVGPEVPTPSTVVAAIATPLDPSLGLNGNPNQRQAGCMGNGGVYGEESEL